MNNIEKTTAKVSVIVYWEGARPFPVDKIIEYFF